MFTLGKVKEIIGMSIFTLFFGLITVFLIVDYIDEYHLFSATKQEVKIIDKVGEKGLFTPPAYFVRVELPNGEEQTYLKRISKRQMKNLQLDDTISGFSTSPRNFSTIRDFLFDSMFFIGAILLFGLFTIGGIFVLITTIPSVDRFFNEKTFLGRTSTGNGMKILIVVMGIFIYFSGKFLYNLFHKLFPFMKTNTEARIIDTYSDISFRKYEDSTFQFTLLFEHKDGSEIKVIKDVTRNTYNHFTLGDSVPISYRNLNPYDIFVNHTTGTDIIQTLLYLESILYLLFIGIILFTAYALFKKRSKEKAMKN